MNYSESPVADPAGGRAERARRADRQREHRATRPRRPLVIAIVVAVACVVCIGGAFAISHRKPADDAETSPMTQDANAVTGDQQAQQGQDGVSAEPTDAQTGQLGDETDLFVTPDDNNGITAGGIGVTLESAKLSRDEGGHGWVTARFRLANPGNDSITLGDNGLELLVSQGDAPLAWDSSCLKDWNGTKLDAGDAKEIDMRFALADAKAPLTLTVTRNGSVMGWTVAVADAASGITPLGVSA